MLGGPLVVQTDQCLAQPCTKATLKLEVFKYKLTNEVSKLKGLISRSHCNGCDELIGGRVPPCGLVENKHPYLVLRAFMVKQNHSLLMFQGIRFFLFKANMAEG